MFSYIFTVERKHTKNRRTAFQKLILMIRTRAERAQQANTKHLTMGFTLLAFHHVLHFLLPRIIKPTSEPSQTIDHPETPLSMSASTALSGWSSVGLQITYLPRCHHKNRSNHLLKAAVICQLQLNTLRVEKIKNFFSFREAREAHTVTIIYHKLR